MGGASRVWRATARYRGIHVNRRHLNCANYASWLDRAEVWSHPIGVNGHKPEGTRPAELRARARDSLMHAYDWPARMRALIIEGPQLARVTRPWGGRLRCP